MGKNIHNAINSVVPDVLVATCCEHAPVRSDIQTVHLGKDQFAFSAEKHPGGRTLHKRFYVDHVELSLLTRAVTFQGRGGRTGVVKVQEGQPPHP